ncbi:MAG: hypothetical protein PHV97_02625, partial [Candidatus Omnitrophica bacterium]|nr:hypothetical protein [Candidatus Omnitrophota bacterium]
RAKLSFGSDWLNLCFVIDSSLEEEKKFSGMLDSFEKAILEQKNMVLEMFFANDRDGKVDYTTLKNDYPFSFALPEASSK